VGIYKLREQEIYLIGSLVTGRKKSKSENQAERGCLSYDGKTGRQMLARGGDWS